MEPTLDQVREELAGIHDQLLALPRDDFAARADLRIRQEELRQLSHKLAEGQQLHDAETLQAAFTRLQHVRDRMLEQHLSPDSTSIGDAGIDATVTAAINKAMDEGSGLDEVEARIQEILKQLRNGQ